MKRQRGVVTWEMLVFVAAFGSATSTTPALTSEKTGPYPTLDSCLSAVDGFNSAMIATRAGEVKGSGIFVWKA